MFSLENGENKPESKVCTKCGKDKLLSEYTILPGSSIRGRNRGKNPECKECEYARRKGERQAYKFAGKPAIPPLGEPCQCCGKTDQRLVFDHCHTTLKFRGWLCKRCNTAIGSLGDTIEGIENAMAYLKGKNKGKNNEQLFE